VIAKPERKEQKRGRGCEIQRDKWREGTQEENRWMKDLECLLRLNEVLHKSIAPLSPAVLYTDAGRKKWRGHVGLDSQTGTL